MTPVGRVAPAPGNTTTVLPLLKPEPGAVNTPGLARVAVKAYGVPASFGPMPAKVPEVAADHRPTNATVVEAGTLNAAATDAEALEPPAAADQVTASRAYAGEPPASSFAPVAE